MVRTVAVYESPTPDPGLQSARPHVSRPSTARWKWPFFPVERSQEFAASAVGQASSSALLECTTDELDDDSDLLLE